MKYLPPTIVLFISLFLGWLASVKYLEPLILNVLNPESHDKYMDIWFSMFVSIELLIVLVYVMYVYTLYKFNEHLTKS